MFAQAAFLFVVDETRRLKRAATNTQTEAGLGIRHEGAIKKVEVYALCIIIILSAEYSCESVCAYESSCEYDSVKYFDVG